MSEKVSEKTGSVVFTTVINLEIHIKLPEIPLDMSVYNGSDIDDLEVKQEPMDSDRVKLEESPPGLNSEDLSSTSHPNMFVDDAQLPTVTGSGKYTILY